MHRNSEVWILLILSPSEVAEKGRGLWIRPQELRFSAGSKNPRQNWQNAIVTRRQME
jgi:hypothetical protein